MTTAPTRRWFRWSLRTMFVVVTVLACWLGWTLHQWQNRRQLLGQLTSQHAITGIFWKDGSKGQKPLAFALWPFAAGQIRMILLEDGHFTDADIDRLEALFPEAELYRCRSVGNQLNFFGYLRNDPDRIP
jgi:hypothetical protein